MIFAIPKPKTHPRGWTGKFLLGAGGAAATWGVYHLLRARKGIRKLADDAYGKGAFGKNDGPISEFEAEATAAVEPDLLQPATESGREENPAAGGMPKADPDPLQADWVRCMQLAMESEPASFGYAKPVWTAPLLSLHLQKEHAFTVPLPRIRSALKDSGYAWRNFRYLKIP